MDAKYLEEIKARCELGRPAQQREVKALLAEVERDERDKAAQRIEIVRLTASNADKDWQIATLKKALEYACADRATTPSMWQDLQKKYMGIAHQAQEQEGKK